jgi:hypothetical protein
MRVTSLYFAGPPVSEAWPSPVLGRGSVPTIECTCSRGRLFHEPHEGVPTEGGGCNSTPVLATTSKNKPCKAYTGTHKFGTVLACIRVQRLGTTFREGGHLGGVGSQ